MLEDELLAILHESPDLYIFNYLGGNYTLPTAAGASALDEGSESFACVAPLFLVEERVFADATSFAGVARRSFAGWSFCFPRALTAWAQCVSGVGQRNRLRVK